MSLVLSQEEKAAKGEGQKTQETCPQYRSQHRAYDL
jgi:hypothetical protein